MKDVDEKFYGRADAHIQLANSHISEELARGRVSASFMYGLARFNSWVSACNFNNAEEMASTKEETIEFFTSEYKKMLEENLDDYIKNFDRYMNVKAENA